VGLRSWFVLFFENSPNSQKPNAQWRRLAAGFRFFGTVYLNDLVVNSMIKVAKFARLAILDWSLKNSDLSRKMAKMAKTCANVTG
jgi:hypothetical protein